MELQYVVETNTRNTNELVMSCTMNKASKVRGDRILMKVQRKPGVKMLSITLLQVTPRLKQKKPETKSVFMLN